MLRGVMQLDTRLKLFLVLFGLFLTSLIVGDLIGGKLYQVTVLGLPLTISVGMIPFPVVFLLTDLINEFYGKRMARYVTYVGAGMAVFTIVVLQVAAWVPFAEFTNDASWTGFNAESFERIFSSSQRILIASVFAYMVAQLADIAVFHVLKKRTHGKMLWLRATGSTVISQLLDTVVIQFLAWTGKLPVKAILSIIVTSYIVKVCIAIALTPVLYAGHAVVERGLGLTPLAADDAAA